MSAMRNVECMYSCADYGVPFVHSNTAYKMKLHMAVGLDLPPEQQSLQNSQLIALLHWLSVSAGLHFYTCYTARSAAGILNCT